MNVGDYVRIINTLNGYVEIIKIKELNEYDGYLLDERDYQYSTDEIIKSSPQIIDLIEVGDYVNGKKVIDTYNDYIFDYSEEFKVIRFSETDILHNSEHIETVLTHEQMEAMQYRVEK